MVETQPETSPIAAAALKAQGGFLAGLRERMQTTFGRRAFIVVLLVLGVIFPYIDGNEGDIDAAANALAFAILALGLNIVVGFAGLLDLGYAAFFAIGAYTYGIFSSYQVQPEWSSFWEPFQWLGLVQHIHPASGPDTVHFAVSFWLMLPISALVAAFFGLIFGAPTLRLKGDYLAIVTLGFGEIVPIVARNIPYLTNGAQGLNGVTPPTLFGYGFGVKSTPFFYLGLAMMAFLIFVSLRLKDSRIGRAWLAIREDEIAAEAMGVNRVKLKLLAFAVGAGFAGATGTFYVAKLQTASPEMFMFPVSVMLLVMIVLGGTGSVAGVVLGALILQLLQSWFLQDMTQWIQALGRFTGIGLLEKVDLVQSIELIFGIILVLMMRFRRQGLIPERAAVTALTHAQQTAVPSRAGVQGGLAPLHRKSVDPTKPLLEIRGLSKSFGGIRAVRQFDLDVMPGSIVGIIGPNGSGKTTFFNLITGLIQPDGGKVLLQGEDVTGLLPHVIVERGIARTFQNLRLFANMTLMENVLVGTHARTRTGAIGAVLRSPRVLREEKAARERVLDALSIFGNRLMPRIQHLARTLSYANRRRLEIARAVVSEPVLLLLDEPTAGMNPTETLELTDQIRHLRDRGVTVLMIEHKLAVVNQIADKVIVLDHGEKIAEGTPKEVHSNKEVLRAYLGRSTDAVAEAAAAS
ncbi:amino acid/amide ABC transporter membrane protein 2, HAAT family /amino acid/amide ABC transporter ATP-binding protein 1, HAAT family [Rhizobiales bacterium GAS188]|nr:amino acid/amide ABC transporter membrane protein 2, HAAT family /amino acid/amide ABC transporter ATP-binding protein 1, HAAT family [Rhizobiales bacterium GAS188]